MKRDDTIWGGRLEWVDAARAVAALMVVLHHFTPISTPFAGLFDFGRVGVLLFFLVSGYCIAFSLEGGGARPLVSFWIRRALRLYPPYWVTIALVALAWPEAHPPSVWLANLTMMQQGLRLPDVLGVFWTLYFELLFYGAVSALLPSGMLRRLDRLLMVGGGLLFAALGFALVRAWAGVALPFSYPLYLAVFFSGMIWFRIDRDHPHLPARVIVPAVVAGLGVVALISCLVFGAATIGEDTALSHFGNHAVAVGLFFLLCRGLRVTAPPVVFVGHVSYSLYLVHTAVPLLIAAAFPGLPHAALLSAMAAFPVAIALHYGVERPSIRLARGLARRVQGRPTIVCSG